jgi:hypothetical protein
MPQLLAEDGRERQHRLRLRQLLASSDGPVRIASAYVTDRELLASVRCGDIRLVTSLLPMDIASGSTSIETLRVLIESGVKCRCVPDRPRLHAKVYVFGTSSAVVTSANLTESAFDSNIEVGVELGEENVQRLIEWYDRLWAVARPILLPQLAELRQNAAELRRDYAKLKRKSTVKLALPGKQSAAGPFRDDRLSLFGEAEQFFVCNTDRRQGERTTTGSYALEEEMYNRGFATAWESFKFPTHMQQVNPGDAVFMFAKGVGIIAIGRATTTYETLEPDDPNRIRNFDHEENTPEWRVPVHWLDWRDEQDAYRWKAPNFTFWNVSDEGYAELREGVRQHFISD